MAPSQSKSAPRAIFDEIERQRAIRVLEHIDLPEIRSVSLTTLAQWRSQGAWCSAHDEWEALMRKGGNDEVIAAMTTQNEESSRLRQSSPYVSLYQVAEEKLRWKELTRPVDEVLSPEGVQYGDVTEGHTRWDLRSRELRAATERELGEYLRGTKVLLYEGAWGEAYMGEVIGLSESFVVQEIFCNSVFAHLRSDIEQYGPVALGQYLRVRYNGYFVELIDDYGQANGTLR